MSIWWGRRVVPGESTRQEVLAFEGDEQPDGVVVELSGEPPSPPLMRALLDAGTGKVRELHMGQTAAHAPALWYVEKPDTSDKPPAMVLVAFATPHLPEGSVVDEPTFATMGVTGKEQAGAIRWWPSSGLVHQVYVSPALRRRGIGTKLIAAAGAYRAARDWKPIWSNGDRTDLGEALTRGLASPYKSRLTPRTRVMPPMTPVEARAGLDQRLLEPDEPL
jgi:GNAT superfamily N-acetyltransferase